MRIALENTISRKARPSAAFGFSRYSTLAPVLQTGQRLPALDPSPATSLCDQLLDEAALIERVNRGDEDAARSLAGTLRPTILKCIRRPLPRWASEEDLVQIVFAKVFGKLRQFSGAVPLRHWVSRIAVNASLSQLAHESVRPELRMSDLSEEQETVLGNISASSGESEETAYAREVLDLLFAQIKPEERMIIVLLHIEQRTTHEISRMTGLSVSSIKVKAFRTRHKMQRLGKRLLREGGYQPVTCSR